MCKFLVLALSGGGVTIEPITLGSDPKLSNGRERSSITGTCPKKILELAAENAYFQHIFSVVFTKEEFPRGRLFNVSSCRLQ